jgi:putative endonuclease
VLGANVRAGGNELDLILRRGASLVFCEVKMRSRTDYGHPAEFVGPEKQRRLRRAAGAWLAARPELADLRVSFEVLAICGERIERTRDAF